MPSKFLNISVDSTLGGIAPSDEVVVSQKAIKEYVDSHSGGGSVSIDGTTISTNTSDEIQAIGLINKNTASGATSPIYDWVGTLAEYEQQDILTNHPDWVCYITDDNNDDAGNYQPDLFDNKWSDYELSDQNWVNASTFSWQPGTFYTNAYNHLVQDYNGGSGGYEVWSVATQNANLGAHSWQDIAFNGSLYVAIGSEGYISTSTDGENWTAAVQNANLGSHSWSNILWDGTKFVALSAIGGYLSTSTDGVNWTAAVQLTGMNEAWEGLAYNGTRYAALDQANYVSSSTDLSSWSTPERVGTGYWWMDLIWDGTRFFGIHQRGYILTSPDGLTWSQPTTTNIGDYTWMSVAWNGINYLAISRDGYVSTSIDGLNWETAVQDANLGANRWKKVIMGSGKYVAIGNDGYISVKLTSKRTDTIAGISITYVLSSDGHKICAPDQESNVLALYNAVGIAWYYILDTTNTRFKLPRSKHEHYGNRPVVGNGKMLGLTIGDTGLAGLSNSSVVGNGVYASGNSINGGTTRDRGASTSGDTVLSGTGAGWQDKYMGVSTDPTKSGIISTPIEDTDQYKYLYFYVGQFNKSATEQTAGLNASLFNNKVDLDAGNLSATGKETIADLLTPDYTAGIDISSSVTGTGYTALKDGVIYYYTMPATNAIDITINSAYITRKGSTSGSYSVSGSAIVKAGDTFLMGLLSGGSVYFYPFKGVN